MTSPLIAELEQSIIRTDLAAVRVGDTIAVHYRIVEAEKLRTHVFKGVVIKQNRAGARSTFTVRKTSSNVGVERTFLTHSPRIEKIEVLASGKVRRSRLYFLRELTGKKARLREIRR